MTRRHRRCADPADWSVPDGRAATLGPCSAIPRSTRRRTWSSSARARLAPPRPSPPRAPGRPSCCSRSCRSWAAPAPRCWTPSTASTRPASRSRKVVGGIADEVVEALRSLGPVLERPNTYGAGTGVTYLAEHLKVAWERLVTASRSPGAAPCVRAGGRSRVTVASRSCWSPPRRASCAWRAGCSSTPRVTPTCASRGDRLRAGGRRGTGPDPHHDLPDGRRGPDAPTEHLDRPRSTCSWTRPSGRARTTCLGARAPTTSRRSTG